MSTILYSLAGYPYGAAEIFSLMQHMGCEPDRASYNIIVDAYGRADLFEEIVDQMRKSELQLDTFVLHNMLNLYGWLGQFQKMEQVLNAMERKPHVADTSTYNSLITVYDRARFIDKMKELSGSLSTKNLEPDVVMWTLKLRAYSKKKQYKKCLKIFEEMIDVGCYLDGGTAKALLNACSSEDQIEQMTTVIRIKHKDIHISLQIS
ncbi:Pentatricopeptide repeat [Dillenia turbinata]|uniref:Pentatricopeptide repeat n=1 Tax=Dillenia turbinata TaxID=194707 RepID=A0AAN8VL59_9MAGN